VAALAAAALVGLATQLPLWQMTLRAPQYPQGLRLAAYGDRLEGDLREINIVNHYIGMREIAAAPAPEMRLFHAAAAALALLCLASPFSRWLARGTILAAVAMPFGILGDLQWWLHRFGSGLDPEAPLRFPPFTPLAVGVSGIGNFTTVATVSWGFGCLLAAAAALVAGGAWRQPRARRAAAAQLAAGAVAAALVLCVQAPPAEATPTAQPPLQTRIDRAAPGATLVVRGGVHRGPIVVRQPLALVGVGRPVIDGGGRGSVIVLAGPGITIRGFRVRGSGRMVTEEAAGIAARGGGHTIEDNDLEDVYFGIHLADGEGDLVRGNRIAPGTRRGARPGHGVSLWNVCRALVAGNRIRAARDGIYLSFADQVTIAGNDVAGCRYGVHSMYSRRAAVTGNRLTANLVGAALMNSERLLLAGNSISRHRAGATAYGVLLKDIDDLRMEGNLLVGNRVGLYADGTPLGPRGQALVRGNLLAGNEAALALQSNVRLRFTGNRVVDNLADARAEGAGFAAANRWSEAGRGNLWSQYRGYDRDGDGVGDLPYRVEGATDGLLRRAPLAQAFLYTPAHAALEAAARLFPLFRREPLLVDPHPLMEVTP
jgi:nitrous oxidase accessory protein